MQLSKLEIKGFKSFGEAVKIDFDRGVTGIVGPNGCGKSNVVDAIRWVLGEQKTRMLRSDKMENILFNGTQKRKPAQVAQVSLTFDNTRGLLPSEFSHVTITRRFHRSGESEYLINEVRCRLKDIHNLFLDTGIGPDSYAIIELKKVDEILSDKENSRRDLFEKAAGISKYKVRKKESLAQLELVDKDLDRVGDLLFEMEKNLRSLERQAKQAERYLRLKKQYQEYSLAFAQKALARAQAAQAQLNTQIEQESQRKEEIQRHIRQNEQAMEEGQKSLDHFELALRNKQQLFNNHQAKIRQLENDKKLRAEKLFYLQEKIEKIRAQIQQDLHQQQQVRQSHQQQVQLQTSVEKQWQEAEALISQTETQHQAQQQKAQELITRLNSREAFLRQKQQAILQDQQSFEIKKTQLSAAKQELENTTGQNQRLEEEIQRYDTDLNQAQEALQMAKTSLQQLKEKEDRRTEELREMEQKVQVQRELLAETQRALDARQNEYQLTESFLNNLEGYPEAIQYLQQSEAHDLPPMPLLSEVVISEAPYRRAIESYLNPWINYYVVATEDEARQAILQLEKAEKGKAHFFILEKLPLPSQPPPSPVDESPLLWGGLDVSVLKPRSEDAPVLALEVVSCDPVHWPLLSLLLQSVWILPHENLPQIAPEDDYVTRDGRIVRRLYQLTGGSVGAFEGKRLGGSRNLAILQSQIAKLNQEISQQKNDLQFQLANLKSLKENRSLREAYERNLQQVNHINEQYISLRSKKEQLTQVVEGNVSRYEEARERIYLLQEEVEALAPQVRQAQDEIAHLQTETENLRQQYQDEEVQLRTLAAQMSEQKRRFYQLENQFQAQVREGEYQQQQLQTLSRRLTQQGEELKTAEAELESLLENEEDYGTLIDTLRAETEDYQRNLQSVEKDYYERRGQRNDLEKNRQTLYKNREQQEEILRRLEQKNHETQLELTSLRERLAAEFNLEVETMAGAEIPEDLLAMEETALRAEASRIRQKIDNLGTVNPMALSEYETQKERYDFISAQKADLEASKKSLLKTLSETESFARQAFMEAYENIRENFIQVFRSLFSSEDRADLVLAEPDNPLESKIEIIAQPKGKRPLTIDQLSGGEKTLTSTSLLFALYLLKPAPFCIFDEVDAPLDDANTDKFNNIIRDFSKNSQFILVTHNKRTMETTDVLYGVVMPETGVSQVVPVSLRQVEQVLENRLQV